VRSPLFLRGKGAVIPGINVRQATSVIDLLPSLAELCNLSAATGKPLDGISFAPWLKNPEKSVTERLIINHWGKKISVRSSRFRLDEQGRLYDMEQDFGQRLDVAAQHPDAVRRLRDAAERYRTDALAELPAADERPFVIAHPGHRFTQVPARDAQSVGGVKRSSRHPNDSYYTNWTTPDDRIYWNAEVAAAGRFEVTLYYTCPEKDVGSSVVLSCGADTLPFTVQEAHDPPLTGAAHDRSPRIESYVKDWKKAVIGEMALAQGAQRLELRAVNVPGSQVMDFRLLVFKRLD
jgi:hypothetical protein